MTIGAARAVLDVKWLGVNVAHDRPVEVRVARKIGRGCRRERGINVKTVPRSLL